jgi:hypothetical protein
MHGKGERQMANVLGAAPIRVLIVEDNRDICENIAVYLEKHRYLLLLPLPSGERVGERGKMASFARSCYS